MTIKRVVPNIEAPDLSAANAFFGDILGMTAAMGAATSPLVSAGTRGRSARPYPDLSIEVGNLGGVAAPAGRGGIGPE